MHITKKSYRYFFLFLLLFVYAGCGTELGGLSEPGYGNLSVGFTLPGDGGYVDAAVAPVGVGSVTIRISGSGMTPINDTFDVSPGATVTRTYDVPVGSTRTISIDVYSGSAGAGTHLYTGSNTVDLTSGVPASVIIDMSAVILQSTLITILGGTGYDYVYSINPTSDDGSILAGSTISEGAGSYDVIVAKLATDGSVDWQKIYGGTGYEYAKSVQETNDGGYMVAGYTTSIGTGGDVWLLKLNSDGSVNWQKTYGGTGLDTVRSMMELSGGGYIVAGETDSFGSGSFDAWVLKLNSNGTVAWQKAVGNTGNEYAHSVRETADGGYIVAGETNSSGAGGSDFFILKFTSAGILSWQKTYGGTAFDSAYSIQETADGGYIVAGYTFSFGAGGNDFLILKLTSTGAISWQKTFGGIGNEETQSVVETIDGGFVIAGSTNGSMAGAGGEEMLALKLSSAGAMLWQKTYGASGDDHGTAMAERLSGDLLLAGHTSAFGAGLTDIMALSLDSSGECAACLTGTPSLALSNTSVSEATSAFKVTTSSSSATDVVGGITVAASTLTRTDICTLSSLSYSLVETSYTFDDITAGATFLSNLDNDNVIFDLPWAFTFYGNNYSAINVDTNGNIWFDDLYYGNFMVNLQTGDGSGRLISVWNEDLFAEYYGAGVHAEAKTSPDRVVVRWETESYDDFGGNLLNLFEVVFYRDGKIAFNYNYFNANSCNDYGSGVSKGDGQDYTSLTLNINAYACTLDGRSFVFTPN